MIFFFTTKYLWYRTSKILFIFLKQGFKFKLFKNKIHNKPKIEQNNTNKINVYSVEKIDL